MEIPAAAFYQCYKASPLVNMITNSFIFLERIGNKLEQNIWKNGIHDWNSFLKRSSIKGLSRHRKLYYDRKILNARKALYNFDSSYFQDLLPQSEMWRLYDFFREDAVFLDIETTGLSKQSDDITVFGLYDGINTKIMIKGINFDCNSLKKELKKYKLIVTFNGASFDLPFIEKRYAGLLPKIPNFDVKSATDRLGLKGGLKNIEKSLSIKRSNIVDKFYGGDALTLWSMYRATGDDYYLNLLVEYNEFDIINLKIVAEHCVKKMKELLFNNHFSSNALPRHSSFKNNP
ncbi:ribonuclease H-like domain-containing protein [Candidatus Woesearchaeota archaeon]|nr:ribonuclease H-like domain-containing protein [Candidatus Woesearchaeota archaeon]